MGFTVAQTYLSDILHVVSQSLLAPDIILLLAFILYALFCIGSVIAEYFTERKHFKVVMPRFLAALMASKEEDIPQVIEHSGLLNRQKEALNTVYEYRALPGDALVALVRRLVSEEETRYDRITGRNNMAAKVSPMLGLMGTLIPLGPGIQALGTADTAALSSSLLVAFDTTVAGLVTAAICLVVGKIRSNWYNNYLSALDAAMATMMEKIEDGRETSTATLPEGAENYSFLFGADEPKSEPKNGIAAMLESKGVAAKSEPKSDDAMAGEPKVDTAVQAQDDASAFKPQEFAVATAAAVATESFSEVTTESEQASAAQADAVQADVAQATDALAAIEAFAASATPSFAQSAEEAAQPAEDKLYDAAETAVGEAEAAEFAKIAATVDEVEAVASEAVEAAASEIAESEVAEIAPAPVEKKPSTVFNFVPMRSTQSGDKPSQDK